ncbi:hypothetical protein LINPERHAP2_LOCUS15252 [Linum perenne]
MEGCVLRWTFTNRLSQNMA